MSISAAIRCENAIVLQAGRFGEWAEFAHPIPDRAVGLGPEGPLDLLDGAEPHRDIVGKKTVQPVEPRRMLVSTRTGMKLENSFEVPAPPEQAWDLLMDVPRVIPCMPGAELTETVGDSSWKAKMTVKLGPMSFAFATDVKREEADVDAQRAKLSARARELRGRGGGQATIESSLTQVDGGTRVHIVTDMALSGAVAQYGRGMVQEVAGQLVDQFADCLRTQLVPASEEAPVAPAASPPPARPVRGLSLALGALRRAIVRFFKRRTS
jgi:uncharacterized protein